MDSEQGRAGWQWVGDPLTGNLSRLMPDGSTLYADVETLTNGTYSVDNRRMFYAANHTIRWNFRANEPFYFTQLEGGMFHILNPIPFEAVNERVNAAGGAVFTYGVKITMPDGSVRTIDDGITAASPAGSRLAVREAELGQLQYLYERRQADTGLFPDSPTASGYRWASPSEVEDRSIISALLRDHHGIIEDAIAMGLEREDGSFVDDDYEAAQVIFANAEVDTSPWIQAVFPIDA